MQPPNHQIVGLGAEFDRSSGRITCPGGPVWRWDGGVEMVLGERFGEVESKVEVRWCLGIYIYRRCID